MVWAVCDFGCCKRVASLSEPTFDDPVGTIHYVAPELAAAWIAAHSMAWVAAAADCWALGIIAYQIFADRPPFDRPSLPDNDAKLAAIASPLARDQIAYPPEAFGHVSEAGRAFLRRLLARAPAERAGVREALDHAWLQPVTDKALRERMVEAAPRPRGKARLLLAARRVVLANRLMNLRPSTGRATSPRDAAPSSRDGGPTRMIEGSPSPGRGERGATDAPSAERPRAAEPAESASSMAASFKRVHAAAGSPSASFLHGSFKGSFHGSRSLLRQGSNGSTLQRSPGSPTGVRVVRGSGLALRADAGALTVSLPSDLHGEVDVDDVDPMLYYMAAHSPERRPHDLPPQRRMSDSAVLDAMHSGSEAALVTDPLLEA